MENEWIYIIQRISPKVGTFLSHVRRMTRMCENCIPMRGLNVRPRVSLASAGARRAEPRKGAREDKSIHSETRITILPVLEALSVTTVIKPVTDHMASRSLLSIRVIIETR